MEAMRVLVADVDYVVDRESDEDHHTGRFYYSELPPEVLNASEHEDNNRENAKSRDQSYLQVACHQHQHCQREEDTDSDAREGVVDRLLSQPKPSPVIERGLPN